MAHGKAWREKIRKGWGEIIKYWEWVKVGRQENYFKRVREKGRWHNNKRKNCTYISLLQFSPSIAIEITLQTLHHAYIWGEQFTCIVHWVPSASSFSCFSQRDSFRPFSSGPVDCSFLCTDFAAKVSSFQIMDIIKYTLYFTSLTIFRTPLFHYFAFRISGLNQ